MKKILGVGALLDLSWDTFRDNFWDLLKINGWKLIYVAVNAVSFMLMPPSNHTVDYLYSFSERIGMYLLIFNNLILSFVVGIWIINSLILYTQSRIAGKKIDMKVISKKSWKLFFPQLLVLFYLVLGYVITTSVPFGLFVLVTGVLAKYMSYSVLYISLFLVLLAFTAPLFYAIYTNFAIYALVDGGFHGLNAIKESFRLVRGRFFAIASRILIPKLLYVVVLILAEVLLLYILVPLGLISGIDSTLFVEIDRYSWQLLIVLTIFINPLMIITDHLIYNDIQ